MTLAEFIADAIGRLKQAGIDNPQLDARWLAEHCLKLDRAQMLAQAQRVLRDDEIKALDAVIARRIQHEPVARIIGCREFWGLNFALNEATLEPRPDSEIIVEAILKIADKADPYRILDLGTGTGCLLLSLLHELPYATGLGIDKAPRAVEQALQNAATLDLGERATFHTGDWLNSLDEKFDIIVSNPPYIPASDIATLMPDVRDYDPRLALDGGADGLAPYRLLIPQLANFLKPQGFAVFEVGEDQAQPVADLFRQSGFTNIETYKDLGRIERCITASKRA